MPLGSRCLRDRRSLATLATTAVLVLPVVDGLGAARAASAADDRATPLLVATNAARSAAGVSPLERAADLDAVAARHAAVMASLGRLHHNPALTEQVSSWEIVGENVGVGPDVESLHRAFLASPSHRANVLKPAFTEAGFGAAVSSGGELWVVEVFRRPIASTSVDTGHAVAAAGAADPTPAATMPSPAPARLAAATQQHRQPAPAPAGRTERAPVPRPPAPPPLPSPPQPPSTEPDAPALVSDTAPVAPAAANRPAGTTWLSAAPARDAGPPVDARQLATLAALFWFVVALQLFRRLGPSAETRFIAQAAV